MKVYRINKISQRVLEKSNKLIQKPAAASPPLGVNPPVQHESAGAYLHKG